MAEDKGYWFTTETGVHIHVEPGETKEQALKRKFGDSYKSKMKSMDKDEIKTFNKTNRLHEKMANDLNGVIYGGKENILKALEDNGELEDFDEIDRSEFNKELNRLKRENHLFGKITKNVFGPSENADLLNLYSKEVVKNSDYDIERFEKHRNIALDSFLAAKDNNSKLGQDISENYQNYEKAVRSNDLKKAEKLEDVIKAYDNLVSHESIRKNMGKRWYNENITNNPFYTDISESKKTIRKNK